MDYQNYLKYKPDVQGFFDPSTNTISYVVADPATNRCAIIDSVLDYNIFSGSLSSESADNIADHVRERGYEVEWILETHMHADHISAAAYLKDKLGGKVAIGNHISEIQKMYQEIFAVPETELKDAQAKFDRLWEDFETFTLGSIPAFTFYTPGHTPADVVYGIGNALFAGDTLFMPDFGTARCDFPGGNAASMYESAQKIFALPDDMRMFMCHDYLPKGGRNKIEYETTIGNQKLYNIHLRPDVSREEFVTKRETRDTTLPIPKLMIPSLQVNVRAGYIPEKNGKQTLYVPVNSVFSTYNKE
ncbi:MAG: MBL fold metallo-hydrolase [Minisyncoccota bacterium]